MSSHSNGGNKYINLLQEFSLPLVLGVVVALVFANASPKLYDKIVNHTYAFFVDDGHESEHGDDHQHDDKTKAGKTKKVSTASESDDEHSHSHANDDSHGHGWQHYFTMHFLINEIFMVFFFGIAAKEITESCLPGGALNPPKKAVNPLMGTIGGVIGPVAVFLLLNMWLGDGTFPKYPGDKSEWANGWGIPTATDIALAWLIARMVFGPGHSAISFLLLLAVADDGIGLIIIAIFYPSQEPEWLWVLLLLPAMVVAGILRWRNVRSWVPYIAFGGTLSWFGLYLAHLHPALALVPIVPFLPAGEKDDGFFQEEAGPVEDNPLDRFEHDLKLIVDFGLFFFAFANAGVAFSSMSNMTWIILLSLLIGKTVGISAFSYVAALCGMPLPAGMSLKHLVVAGVIAGLGLTVALFVAGQAFPAGSDQGAAKMGALFSGGAAIIAIALGRILGVKGTSPPTISKSLDE